MQTNREVVPDPPQWPMFTTYILPFLIYWLVLFVACYITVEWSQNYLYDETTAAAGLKVLLGTLIFAAILTYTHTRFDTMLTDDIGLSVLQAIVWFGVFTFVFRFNPVHAFGISVVAFVMLSGLSTLAVDSFSGTNPSGAPASRRPAQPIRRSIGSPFSAPPTEKGPAEKGKTEKTEASKAKPAS